jgi:hypothetical protein
MITCLLVVGTLPNVTVNAITAFSVVPTKLTNCGPVHADKAESARLTPIQLAARAS